MSKEFLQRIAKLSPQRLALLATEMQEKIDALENASREPIAIIGVGCRVPGGVSNADEYWTLLRDGVDAISEVPRDRWDAAASYDPDPDAPGKLATRWGGFLDRVDQFDAGFFSIAPREAASMDPQQRLLLEVAWESLEDADISPDSLTGSRTGVFVGICNSDYAQLLVSRPATDYDAYLATGSSHSVAAGRLSYFLGLQGPCVAIDTSCSSSLVAVHMACQSLRSGECQLALAGGVNLILTPEVTIALSRAHMMAPDGRCKTFDAAADGFVRGEGCGMIALKRISDALRDGDRILAVIRGSATNQDGRSGGLTAPNGPAQEAVLRLALANAGVSPADVGYIEAHGTGTSLGDPIEVQALGAVLGEGRAKNAPLFVGSVKTNIGHLEAAAGIAGLIKVALSLEHGEIFPHLHLKKKSPHIDWEHLAIEIPTQRRSWPVGAATKRIAGVSSFGFSGTNAHVILEQAPEPKIETPAVERPLHLLALSAKSTAALRELVARFDSHLKRDAGIAMADVAFSANAGRAHFSHRLAAVAKNTQELRVALAELAKQGSARGVVQGEAQESRSLRIAFLFTGQGSQYGGMGRDLYETAPVFREAVDRCTAVVAGQFERPLLDVIFGDGKKLEETQYTQPALFALEWGLAELWRSWGIQPAAVLGHSIGEYVAAAVAGVFSPEDGMKLVTARGRLMQQLGAGGAMLAVRASEDRVRRAIEKNKDRVTIAAINGLESVVISGFEDAIAAIESELQADAIGVKRLAVSHGFHSPQMDAMLDEWQRTVSSVTFNLPKIPIASNVTGELIDDGRMGNAQYWRRHVRDCVQFDAGMRALVADGQHIFLEIGPHPVLTGMAREFISNADMAWFGSLQKSRPAWPQMLASLADLYTRGARVDWAGFDRGYARRKIALPAYPFQRRRYWIETSTPTTRVEISPSSPQRAAATSGNAEWFYQVEWRSQSLGEVASSGVTLSFGHWIVFSEDGDLGGKLSADLGARRIPHTIVTPGDRFEKLAAARFAIRFEESDDFSRVLEFERGTNGTGGLKRVCVWASLASDVPDSGGTLSPEKLASRSIALVSLMKAMSMLDQASPAELWILTRGAQSVVSEDRSPCLAEAPLWGFGKVFALEQPEMWGGQIDFGADAAPSAIVECLFGEMQNAACEDEIAFRAGGRYVSRLARRPAPVPQEPRFRDDRTYLLTGGLGGLGLKLARWLVDHGARHLVLLGRKKIPLPSADTTTNGDARLAAIRELESRGARVDLSAGDAANRGQMQALLARIAVTMPALGGIFHLATEASFATLSDMQSAQIQAMFRSKCAAAWVLHELTRVLPLDHFVMFSSVASLWGARGFAHYAAANQFLGALAHERRAHGLPALTVDWGGWDEIRRASEDEKRFFERIGLRPMASTEAFRALGSLISSGATQMAVADVNWSALKQVYEMRRARLLFSDISAEDTRAEESATPGHISLREIAETLRPRLARLVDENGLAVYAELSPKVDVLCRDYILETLERMGCDLAAGRPKYVADLRAQLKVAPDRERIFGRMLEILGEDGLASLNGGIFQFRERVQSRGSKALQGELIAAYPDYANELELLGRCGAKLDAALRGEVNALSILFPEGSLASAERVYEKSPENRAYNALLQDAVQSIVGTGDVKPVRVLEIGAGTGGSTAYVLPALQAVAFEYVFTDVAPIFLTHGREKFKKYKGVSYRLFDLEKEPGAQGFGEREFDMIVAANVIHATANLRRSLARVRKLLAPGGVLLLLELTRRSRGADLTFGLMDGWWKFEDTDLRTSYPLLQRRAWKRLLDECGFAQVETIPRETQDDLATQQTLIMAREPAANSAQFAQTSRRSEAEAQRRSVASRNWLDNMEALDPIARRAALKAQIRQELIAVLNLDDRDEIRDDQTFASLGLDSLTALELKNHLQQRVGCSLPPTIAFDQPTIAAMAEYLDALTQAASDSAAVTKSTPSGRQEFGL